MPEEKFLGEVADDELVDESTDEGMEESADETEEQPVESESDTADDAGTDDEPEETDDEYADFDEWRKQYDLPDEIKSEDDLANHYRSASAEAKRLRQIDELLKTRGFEGGVDSLLSGTFERPHPQAVETPKEGEKYFGENLWTKRVRDLIDRGQIKSDEARSSYLQLAEVGDSVLQPVVDKVDQVMSVALTNIQKMQKRIDDLMWEGFSHKNKDRVSRRELDEVRRRYGIDGYGQAMNYLLVEERPDLIDRLTKEAKEEGFKKGHKKLKRTRTMPKQPSGTGDKPKYNLEKYLNPDGTVNNTALDRLDLDVQIKILDELEKRHRPR